MTKITHSYLDMTNTQCLPLTSIALYMMYIEACLSLIAKWQVYIPACDSSHGFNITLLSTWLFLFVISDRWTHTWLFFFVIADRWTHTWSFFFVISDCWTHTWSFFFVISDCWTRTWLFFFVISDCWTHTWSFFFVILDCWTHKDLCTPTPVHSKAIISYSFFTEALHKSSKLIASTNGGQTTDWATSNSTCGCSSPG